MGYCKWQHSIRSIGRCRVQAQKAMVRVIGVAERFVLKERTSRDPGLYFLGEHSVFRGHEWPKCLQIGHDETRQCCTGPFVLNIVSLPAILLAPR